MDRCGGSVPRYDLPFIVTYDATVCICGHDTFVNIVRTISLTVRNPSATAAYGDVVTRHARVSFVSSNSRG